jgi:hypothetical protein
MKKLLTLSSLIFLSSTVFATVTISEIDCPEQFEGKVRAIVQEFGPEKTMSFQKVVFDNLHTLKGEVPKNVSLDILKNGPFSIEAGEEYRVQLNEGKLCWIERL